MVQRSPAKGSLSSKVRAALKATDKYRPFSKNGKGDPTKDYYRGQWDVLTWVLEDLIGEEL
jgi:hypothetical protein